MLIIRIPLEVAFVFSLILLFTTPSCELVYKQNCCVRCQLLNLCVAQWVLTHVGRSREGNTGIVPAIIPGPFYQQILIQLDAAFSIVNEYISVSPEEVIVSVIIRSRRL